VLEDRKLPYRKKRPLTSKKRTLGFVTAKTFVTATRVLGYKLAKGVFSTMLDHSRVTCPADPYAGSSAPAFRIHAPNNCFFLTLLELYAC